MRLACVPIPVVLAVFSGACTGSDAVAPANGASGIDGAVRAGDNAEVPVGADAPVTHCDLAPCEGRSLLGMQLPACCLADGVCGVGFFGVSSCFETAHVDGASWLDGGTALQPIALDPACTGTVLALAGDASFVLPGCCAPEGICGLNTEVLRQFTLAPSESCAAGLGPGETRVPCDYGRAIGADAGLMADAGLAPDA